MDQTMSKFRCKQCNGMVRRDGIDAAQPLDRFFCVVCERTKTVVREKPSGDETPEELIIDFGERQVYGKS